MGNVGIVLAARDALRISSNYFDVEIAGLVDAARLTMVNSGIKNAVAHDDENPLTRLAVITYVKANFGLDNPESEKYQRSFDSIVTHLKSTTEFGEVLA